MMGQFKFKACPKCRGDVYLDRDSLGSWYESCLQCGHVSYLDALAERELVLEAGKRYGHHRQSRITDTPRN